MANVSGSVTNHIEVILVHDSLEFLICTLGGPVHLMQQSLNLKFSVGENITFYLNGNGKCCVLSVDVVVVTVLLLLMSLTYAVS